MQKTWLNKRFLAWALVLCLSLPLTLTAQATAGPAVQAALDQAVSYYETDRSKELSDWWELAAIAAAGENLENYALPPTPAAASQPTDYAALLLGELIKGRARTAKAQELAALQTPQGHFTNPYPNQQAWAILALDRMGTSYNVNAALTYLLTYQLPDGGFGYTADDPAGDPDLSAMAALALAPHAAAYSEAVNDLKGFFRATQTQTGGWAAWGSENAATIAVAVMGLIAVGEDPAAITHPVSGKTPVDALLSYQLPSGAFKLNAEDATANPFATKQAALALADLVNESSFLATLAQSSPELLSVSVSIRSASALPVEERVTVPFNATPETAATKAWTKAGAAGSFTAADYAFSTTAPLQTDETSLSLLENTVTLIADFDEETATIAQGEPLTLALTATPPAGGARAPVAGATITIDGQPYGGYPNTTASDGTISLTFLEAGAFIISAQSPSGEVLSMPACTVTVPSEAPYARTLSVRVEGATARIAYQNNLTLSSPGNRVLTAMDALEEVLGTIPHAISGGYISSIASEPAGGFGEDYDGWQFLLNGRQPATGANRLEIADGDELVFYYGGMTTTWYPEIEKERLPDGSLRITFTAEVTEYDASWNPVVTQRPIAGATVLWDSDSFATDVNGQITVPPGRATPGYHPLQIEKYASSGLPLVVRLAPDYMVVIERQVTLTAAEPTGDLTGVPAGIPVRVTVGAGVGNPALMLTPAAQLPEITVTGGAAPLWVPQNTIVTGESGWNAVFSLPQTKSVSLSGKTVTFAALAGSESHTLSFSRPVRLLLPGGADKEIGIIDKSATYQAITASLPVDSLAAAEARLTDAAPFAKAASGLDAALWVKKGGVFVVCVPDSSPPPQPDRVTLSVYGYQGETLFPPTQVPLQGGDTPLSVLLRESGLSVGLSGSYVNRIGTLSEFDHGSGSGWMYQVDGTAPSSTAADAYSLQRGEHVSWRYTTDLGEDIGSAYVPPAGREIVLTEGPDTLTAGFEVAAAAFGGAVSAALDQEQIKEALRRGAAAIKPGQKLTVLARLAKTPAASRITISLDKNGLYALKTGGGGYLAVESREWKIRLDGAALSSLYDQAEENVAVTLTPGEDNRLAVEFFAGDKKIAPEGQVRLFVSYPLKAGERAENIAVFSLKEGRRIPVVQSAYGEDLVVFACSGGGEYQILSQAAPFADLESHWAEGDVAFLYNRELVGGRGPGSFAPDEPLTRAEFIKILCSLAQGGTPTGPVQGFADVPEQAWYAPYIAWGVGEGIVSGMGGGLFGPDAALTREQAAVMLQKAAGSLGWELSQGEAGQSSFSDGDVISPWAAGAVLLMQRAGILSGREDGRIDPSGVATRAEGAAILRRLIENPLLP